MTTIGVRLHASGRFEARYKDPGTGKRRSVYAATEDEARELAEAELNKVTALASHSPALVRRQPLSQWLQTWLADVDGTISQSTYDSYAYSVRRMLPFIGAVPVEELTAGMINDMLKKLEDSGSSLNTRVYTRRCLRQALKHAVENGILTRNVVHLSKVPYEDEDEPETEPLVLTPAEVGALFATLDEDHRKKPAIAPKHAMVALWLSVPLRRGELLGLPEKNLNFEAGTVSIKQQLVRSVTGEHLRIKRLKTRASRRTAALPPVTLDLLEEHLWRQDKRREAGEVGLGDEWGLVFTDRHGNPWNPNTIRTWFDRLCKRAGIRDARLHDLRHTAVSLAIWQGASLEAVQKLAGHKNIATTADVYLHMIPQGTDEIVARTNRMLAEQIAAD